MAVVVATEHAHHWIIESPEGEFCNAVCQGCGAERQFVTAYDGKAHGRRPAGIYHVPMTAPRCPNCGQHPRSRVHRECLEVEVGV